MMGRDSNWGLQESVMRFTGMGKYHHRYTIYTSWASFTTDPLYPVWQDFFNRFPFAVQQQQKQNRLLRLTRIKVRSIVVLCKYKLYEINI